MSNPIDPNRHHRRVYDPYVSDLNRKVDEMNETMQHLNTRVQRIEEQRKIDKAVRKRLDASAKGSWKRWERVVTISAALIAALGTLIETYVRIH